MKSLPKTVNAARAAGMRMYFTGNRCKYGHMSPRYLNGSCIECQSSREGHGGKPRARKKKVQVVTIPGARFIAGRCQSGSA